MRRRQFIGLTTAAGLAVPLASAKAQQSTKPVIGYLSFAAFRSLPAQLGGFRAGLAAEGFVEGQNVFIEYRSADSKDGVLPDLAADLVRRGVDVLAALGPPAALAAKQATRSIPIVFASGADPLQLGLVSRFNEPGGNVTGVYFLSSELVAKRLGLFHELVPRARRIAVLINHTNVQEAALNVRSVADAARTLGLEVRIFEAGTSAEIDAAFAALVDWQADALFVGPGPFFSSQRVQLATLATRHSLPASYSVREIPEVGGLMSYGSNVAISYRQAGAYVGQILKGAKAGDLPVVQPTHYHLVFNLKTAKALGIEVPPMLLARADEVIE